MGGRALIGAFGNEVNPRWYRTTHPLGGGEGGIWVSFVR
jgi:hypothetical protein